MDTPLDYYLHNSTFIALLRRAEQMCKTSESLPAKEAFAMIWKTQWGGRIVIHAVNISLVWGFLFVYNLAVTHTWAKKVQTARRPTCVTWLNEKWNTDMLIFGLDTGKIDKQFSIGDLTIIPKFDLERYLKGYQEDTVGFLPTMPNTGSSDLSHSLLPSSSRPMVEDVWAYYHSGC